MWFQSHNIRPCIAFAILLKLYIFIGIVVFVILIVNKYDFYSDNLDLFNFV